MQRVAEFQQARFTMSKLLNFREIRCSPEITGIYIMSLLFGICEGTVLK